MKKCCNNPPAVSVIIPVYNAGERLRLCVDSALNQDFTDFELILVDDGSTDGSAEVCDLMAASDSRIRVVHQPNSGPGASRNAGLGEAAGKWIAFIDADDTVARDYLSCMMSVNPQDGDLVITGVRRVFADGSPGFDYFSFGTSGPAEDPSDLIDRYYILTDGFPVSKLFDRELVMSSGLRFNTEITFHEDHIFCLEYLLRCNRVSLVEGTPYFYWDECDNKSLSTRKHSTGELIAGAEGLSSLMKAIYRKYPGISKRSFSRQFSAFGLVDFLDAYKSASSREERQRAARAIRSHRMEFLQYFKLHRKPANILLITLCLLNLK